MMSDARLVRSLRSREQKPKISLPFLFSSAGGVGGADKKWKGNFWFLLPRPKGADEARITHHQGSIQNTFELRSIYTAKIRNQKKRTKLGRAFGATPFRLPIPILNFGGDGRIRTSDTRKGIPHFECGPFNLSGTSPNMLFQHSQAKRSIDHHKMLPLR